MYFPDDGTVVPANMPVTDENDKNLLGLQVICKSIELILLYCLSKLARKSSIVSAGYLFI